jgi:hypothetical protein
VLSPGWNEELERGSNLEGRREGEDGREGCLEEAVLEVNLWEKKMCCNL